MSSSSAILYITCYCGLSRLLPDGTIGSDGEKVTLAPCPRCGAGFSGVFRGGKVEVEG